MLLYLICSRYRMGKKKSCRARFNPFHILNNNQVVLRTLQIYTKMAVLGKRKASESAVSREDANDIFRRHFEAQFAPLEDKPPAKKTAVGKGKRSSKNDDDSEDSDSQRRRSDGEDDSDEDSEWGGVSGDEALSDDDEDDDDEEINSQEDDYDDDDEDEGVVEVVDHSTSQVSKPTTMSKRELKAFMVRPFSS